MCIVNMMGASETPSAEDEVCNRLLQRVANGDRDALAKLFQIDAGRLLAIAKRILRRQELAEEVVQEAFVSAWRNAATFDSSRGTARAWMTTIIRNRALNLLRDNSRLEFMPTDEIVQFSESMEIAEQAYASLAEHNALKGCLEKLAPERRKSILLSYVVGYSHGEIAAELKVPLGTIKAWIRRSILALQECLS